MGKTTKKSFEEFSSQLKDKYGEGTFIVVGGDHQNNRSKLLFKHNECGEEFNSTPKDMLRKTYGCPTCARKNQRNRPRLSHEEFLIRFSELKPDYDCLSEYKTSRTKVKVRHKACGAIFYVTGNNLLTKDTGCPNCKESKGERAVKDFLTEIDVPFRREVAFDGCRYKSPLRFDFVIGELESPSLIIEFDGEQHFKVKDFFGGQKGFELTKLRDEIKNKFCESNEINLLRIPYYQIESIPELITNALPRQLAS